ncbi:MAG: pseudouridine synthase [Thermostichales cyanobacterium SZTDM-1c_bins_54]
MTAERIQKLLAHWGIASRRHAEALIQAGRISLNGEIVRSLGSKADPTTDTLALDGQILHPPHRQPQTLLLHKPIGILSTCRDPQGRRTVLDLLPAAWRAQGRFYPIGRLDADSSGALLLTNDGELTLRLSHPRYHVPKTYRVRIQGIPRAEAWQQLRGGMVLTDGPTQPVQVRLLRQGEDWAEVEMILREGRNRQIRRMWAQLGHPVLRLHRTAIGSLRLGALGLGKFRPLDSAEVRQLIHESHQSHTRL